MVKEKNEIKLYKIGAVDIINQKNKSEAKELFKRYIKNEILENLKKQYNMSKIRFQWRNTGFNDPIAVYVIYSSIEYKEYLSPFVLHYDIVVEENKETKLYCESELFKTIVPEELY